MDSGCAGCREDIALPFKFKMAFRPIVDLSSDSIWGYEALVRGINGESAFSVLSQVSDDQAARVMAIETAGRQYQGRDLSSR